MRLTAVLDYAIHRPPRRVDSLRLVLNCLVCTGGFGEWVFRTGSTTAQAVSTASSYLRISYLQARYQPDADLIQCRHLCRNGWAIARLAVCRDHDKPAPMVQGSAYLRCARCARSPGAGTFYERNRLSYAEREDVI